MRNGLVKAKAVEENNISVNDRSSYAYKSSRHSLHLELGIILYLSENCEILLVVDSPNSRNGERVYLLL